MDKDALDGCHRVIDNDYGNFQALLKGQLSDLIKSSQVYTGALQSLTEASKRFSADLISFGANVTDPALKEHLEGIAKVFSKFDTSRTQLASMMEKEFVVVVGKIGKEDDKAASLLQNQQQKTLKRYQASYAQLEKFRNKHKVDEELARKLSLRMDEGVQAVMCDAKHLISSSQMRVLDAVHSLCRTAGLVGLAEAEVAGRLKQLADEGSQEGKLPKHPKSEVDFEKVADEIDAALKKIKKDKPAAAAKGREGPGSNKSKKTEPPLKETKARPQSGYAAAPANTASKRKSIPPGTAMPARGPSSTSIALHPPDEPSARGGRRAQGLWDFVAQQSTQLSFKAGDRLTIVAQDGQWWTAVDTEGKSGHIPHNYVELLPETPRAPPPLPDEEPVPDVPDTLPPPDLGAIPEPVDVPDALPPPPPAPTAGEWIEAKTPEGHVYEYNSVTHETRWKV